jgi:glycosyltransferase involved in cell wall biosynthesis
MRITIVLGPFLPVPTLLGGAVEKVHVGLAAAYRDAGHEVTIVSRRYMALAREETVDGIRHIRIPSSDRSSSLTMNLVRDLGYAERVARSLPVSDVTVTNSFFLPLMLPRRAAGKIYVHVARFPKGQMALYFRADRLQAISRTVADAIAAQVPPLAGRVATIGYPVPDAYFAVEPVRARCKTVLFVGRIAREKGVHLLVRAFAEAHAKLADADRGDWKLRIVGPHEITQGGDGAGYLDELRALAAPLGQACEFAGPMFGEQELIAEYRAASIFVYPSLAERGEAFGLAALEAMASGCCVVVSALGCFRDFVVPGVNGLIFDHRGGAPELALRDALKRLMAEPETLAHVAQQGATTARQFTTDAIAARMLEDFARLVLPAPATRSETATGECATGRP